MSMKYNNQTIEIKGTQHPDSLADRFADVAIKAIERFNPELYANVDKSYLKAGKFPTFNVLGYLSFDFREYSKEYRYELFNNVKDFDNTIILKQDDINNENRFRFR